MVSVAHSRFKLPPLPNSRGLRLSMTLRLMPIQPNLAGKTAMLDLGAAVHDHGEAGILRQLRGFLADHAQLHPDIS